MEEPSAGLPPLDRLPPLAARSGGKRLCAVTTKLASQSIFSIIAGERGVIEKPGAQSSASEYPFLRPSEDGGSLLTPRSELVFRRLGLDGRRRSLEVAYERGPLAVLM